ncbi:50S ribosomal protein L13 [Rickettsiales bacterium LUAb2]
MKTYSPKLSEIENKWYVIDATGASLGRLSALIATRLRGKHKATFAPHMNNGDNIIVTNVEKLKITTKKLNNNFFYWHTGYIGGIKKRSWKDIIEGNYPDRLLFNTVKRMLPKGPLGREQLRHLYLYKGDTHKHEAQKPEALDIAAINPKNKR